MNIKEITDFSAPELDVYARLSENQLLHYYEPNGGLFIAESPKVIARAWKAGCRPVSLLVEDRHVEGEAKELLAQCPDIPVYTASLPVLTKLTGYALTRGALCCMHRPACPELETICRGKRRIAILENVMNPTNVGAIFRSAAALNMDAVLLTPGCSDPLYRRASRVSMGTVFQVPWTWITPETLSGAQKAGRQQETPDSVWPQPAVSRLRELGFRTAALALSDDSVSIDDPELVQEEKLALILGTEGDGLAAGTIADCDYTVRIPMSHEVDSLNVAAASAVAFWQLR